MVNPIVIYFCKEESMPFLLYRSKRLSLLYGYTDKKLKEKVNYYVYFINTSLITVFYMSLKELKTKQIIAAATQEFISKGYDASTMSQISETAEVSKRTLYKYFKNKEDLLIGIVDQLLEEFSKGEDIPFSEEIFSEQLATIVDEKIVLITDPQYMKLAKLVLGQLMKANFLEDRHLESMQKTEGRFAKWIEQGQDIGKVNKEHDSQEIASQIFSVIKGQLFYPVLFGFKTISNEDIETTKKHALDYFHKCFCK